jgi:hypothetical protein
MIKLALLNNTMMVQHTQINKWNMAHKQNKGQKSCDHFNGCRKGL